MNYRAINVTSALASLQTMNALDNALPVGKYRNELCYCWITRRFDTDALVAYETQYVLLNNGTMLKSCEAKTPNPNFGKHVNGKPFTWTPVTEFPEAEYIGNYPRELVKA
jgi:hypothetical protein